MKRYILSLVLLFLTSICGCANKKAEDHYLTQIEEWASAYNLELLKADLQQIKDVEGKPFYVVKKSYSLDYAYDNLTYWLSESLATYDLHNRKDKEQLLTDWRSCKQFMIAYALFDFDGFCDKHFADYLSREEYMEITDFLYDNL